MQHLEQILVVVTKHGWGINDKGQLGLGHRWIVDTPQRLTDLDNCDIVHVACGQQHAVAVSVHGDCYSWGLGVFVSR